MNKKIYINDCPFETRVAIYEDGRIADFFVERGEARGTVGNIYKGKVGKVLQGIQSAFIDVGLPKDTFLHVSDTVGSWNDFREFSTPGKRSFKTRRIHDHARIDEMFKSGQEILVQIVKETVSTKGARVTMRIALPGRYFIYMPGIGRLGISRHILNRHERQRLRRIVTTHRAASDGFITRTAAENAPEDELVKDMKNLIALWEDIKTRAQHSHAPSLIHTDVDVIGKTIRDHFTSDADEIAVDSKHAYGEAMRTVERMGISHKENIVFYEDHTPIFEKFGIEDDIQKSLKPRVWLPSGGHIVINQTEALVAIDVNTGKFVGKKNLEDTVFQLNMTAVKEIVRQIRLRDLGGIIIIDFIDMENPKNRQRVMQAFREELRSDRAQSKILQISDFGLIEMTRKSTRTNLLRTLNAPCPYCDGAGQIKGERTVLFEIGRRIAKLAPTLEGKKILVKGHPDIIQALRGLDGFVKEIENNTQKFIVLKPDPTYHHEQYDILGLKE